ncbi:MAG: tRNA preQ1(34) S-adenosylmethionine ribosyltransferase-isomerase QueA [Anaerolineae bacterium]|nr:tRNA preQ1(34) S-adenosylmethionine ribosyltransferase-isomerase QueA [Anaerolineae bacterium]
MKTSDFDYHLPPEAIAQTPLEPRDSSRLLVINRRSGDLAHRRFHEISAHLRPGDLLVANQTRVIPARLLAHKIPSGGRVELLLLNSRDALTWEVMAGGKRVNTGKRLALANGIQAEVIAELDGPRRIVRFDEPLEPHLSQIGQVPLPPYIQAPLADPERYQTVFAQQAGSAAAPTAGLHFTPRLLDQLAGQGIDLVTVTLHVGLDTFAPVTEENPAEHHIHTEWCQMTPEAAQAINAARQAGGRIVAVGTTSVRVLETAARAAKPGQTVAPFEGATDLFIVPGYTFRAVDVMITNFHLPRSTLLMLVSAFAGRERILAAYETAVEQNYRFYSFGDAMMIE